MDEKHERTGSVKFADQADEAREVREISLLSTMKYIELPSIEFVTTSQYTTSERFTNMEK